MNCNYDQRCISKASRHHNGILACEIVNVNHESREITFRMPYGSEKVRIHPSDFEITEYKVGMYVDVIASTLNGIVRSAQLIGLTPPAFAPEK